MIDSPRKLSPITMGIMFALYVTPAVSETLPTLDETTTDSAQVESSTTLDKQNLQEAPHNNPTISQALKHEPRVGIDDGQNSLRGGDLAPEEISLSGARPHQTKYTIGGVGVNNITTFSSNKSSTGTLSSGHTSGYFLDTTLLESVEVMDHNVSPEFGGFTGGVINAELRKPTDKFTIEYQYRMTDSDWNAAPKVADKLREDYDKPMNGDGRYQPNYQKRMHSLHMSGAINENHKIALNVSKQESDIPQQSQKNVDQGMDNLFLTHIWEADNWRTTSDLRYSEFSSKLFMNDVWHKDVPAKNSDMKQKHMGLGGTIKVERFTDYGIWETSLSYDRLSDQRESNADYMRTNMIRKLNPFSMEMNTEGGYGDLEQYQDSIQLKTTARFVPLYWRETKHTVDVGLEAAMHKATAKRESEYLSFLYKDFGSPIATNMTYFNPVTYSADSKQFALFMNDKMAWDRLAVNLGGRIENNQLFNQTVFAPRITASWDFAQDTTNRVTLGASRYYSNSLLGWALRAESNKLKTNGKDCTPIDGNWDSNDRNNYKCSINTVYETFSLKDAETPYADELSAIWELDIDNFAFTTAYVYREQRKGLSFNSKSQTLLNNIKSNTHIASLDVSTIKSYPFAAGYFTANLNLAYSQRKGSGNTNAVYDADNDLSTVKDDWVVVDGKLMRTSEMETGGYQSPLKSSLSMVMYWPEAGVTWNNRFNYQQGRDLTVLKGVEFIDTDNDGSDEPIKSVETATVDDLVTWDMAMNWTPSQLNKHVTLGVSVTNILDESAKVSTSGVKNDKVNPTDFYSKGREVWLNLILRN